MARATELLREMKRKDGGRSGRTISDSDRRIMDLLLGEGSRNVSDADRARVNELLREMKRKDGGMARKTRVF